MVVSGFGGGGEERERGGEMRGRVVERRRRERRLREEELRVWWRWRWGERGEEGEVDMVIKVHGS